MRGLASLGVVCYHFSNGTMPSIVPNGFGSFFEWARLGIPMFFVISAFVIPYSMYTAGYTVRNAGRYFIKRMARMAPPAWASIAILISIYFGAILLNGDPISGMTWPGTSVTAVLSNLLFSFVLFDVDKYIEVYWTLEVEFQFYILIALLLPLILRFHANQLALSLIFIGMSTLYFINPERVLFFKYNSYFIMGILLFLYKMKLVGRNYFIYAFAFASIACYMQVGMMNMCGAVIGIFLIAYLRFSHPVTNFLGMISFSLYITHHNVGVVAEFLLRNLYGPDPSEPVRLLMFAVYLALAIGFAWVFYKFVEEPSLKLSKRIIINPEAHALKAKLNKM